MNQRQLSAELVGARGVLISLKGVLISLKGAIGETNEIVTLICSCHNFFSLSSVQILFIPACCLLCVL